MYEHKTFERSLTEDLLWKAGYLKVPYPQGSPIDRGFLWTESLSNFLYGRSRELLKPKGLPYDISNVLYGHRTFYATSIGRGHYKVHI